MTEQSEGSSRVSGVASQAGDQARETTGKAVDKTREVAGQASEKAQDQVREQVGQRSDQVGAQVGSAADDAHAVSDQLRQQGNDTAARLVDQAAGRARSLADYLSQSDPDRILTDVQDYARRQPWIVALGGVAVGFAASRMVKASSRDRGTTAARGTNSTAASTANTGSPLPVATEQGTSFAANSPAGEGLAGGHGV